MHPLTRRAGRTLLVGMVALLALAVPAISATTKPPTVTTLPIQDPTLLTDTYALISGVVNPNGVPTVYKFEYGTTTAYGTETPTTSASNGKVDVAVDAALDDLTPNTTYHFRLVAFPDPAQSAYYGVAQTAGEDQTFTTAPSLLVSFAAKKVDVIHNKVVVGLTTIGPIDTDAAGKLKLKAKIHKKVRTVGVKAYSVTTGKTKAVVVKLGPKARKAFKKGKLKKVTATAKTKGIKTAATAKLKLVKGA